MQKLLILGGSHRDIGLIEAVQSLGFFVITLANLKEYLGHKFANKFYLINFCDLQKTREIIKKEQIDFIIPGSSEAAYQNALILAKEIKKGNFDDLKTAKIIHNKLLFKKTCQKLNIPVPKDFLLDLKKIDFKKNANINCEFLLKPPCLSGGKGVRKFNNLKQLENFFNQEKIDKEQFENYFLEEYITGQLIAYSVFLYQKKVVYDFVANDDVFLNKYLISTSYPKDIDPKLKEEIKYSIEKLAEHFNLVNGMFHLQIILKKSKFYIIDVTRRIPGDLFPKLMEFCDEISYLKAVVQSYTTNQINLKFLEKNNKQNLVIRHCVMPEKNGKYKKIVIANSIKNKVFNRLDLIEENTQIKNYLTTSIAIIFIKIAKFEKNLYKKINELIKVEII